MLDQLLIEKEFGYLEPDIYLNISSVAMPPVRVRDVCRSFMDDYVESMGRKVMTDFEGMREETKKKLAQLINANPEEIIFVKNTTEGNSILASGYQKAPGGNVVICDLEHPSNLFPWINARSRGVEIKAVKTREGQVPAESVLEQMDEDTRVVSLSAIEYGSGFFTDLKTIGRECRRRGIVFAVDGIQALGRMEIDVEDMCIDYLAAGGFKGLMGTLGAGFVYCSPTLISHIVPPYSGYQSTVSHGVPPEVTTDFQQLPWHDDIRRLESGSLNTYGIMAMDRGVDLILELGIRDIQEHIINLERYLRGKLSALPVTVWGQKEPERWSGIIVVQFPARLFQKARDIMDRYRIYTTLREGYIRISIGLYNTKQQMDSVYNALRELVEE
ncbi:MAG: aminotransferase class V-fold PLP-dependent enzyme [Clostridium sp.]|nr:aminotransferase class V-fold PLP-dependent enzyme [Clostridium sp.]